MKTEKRKCICDGSTDPLTVAAPDLLEAARGAEWLIRNHAVNAGASVVASCLKKLSVAVAKAEGR